MRVCVLTTSFPRRSGDEASVFVGKLVSAFSEVGMSGFVVVPLDDKEKEKEQWGEFTVYRYKYGFFIKGQLAFGRGILPNLKRNPLLLLQVPGLLGAMFYKAYRERAEWDVLHANWIVSGCVAYLLSVFTSKPFVVTVRGEDAKLLSLPVLDAIFSRVLKRASGVVSVNKSFLSELPSHAICIPNGTEYHEILESEKKAFCARKGLAENGKYILFVGRVIPLKRVEKLIEIISDRSLEDYTLLIIGRVQSGYGERLKQVMKNLSVEDRVRFEESVPHNEISAYLSLSRLYMSASSHEGRSNSMLEALAAGVPVVASSISGHAEIIEDGQNGILFDERAKTQAVALEVSALLENEDRYHRMSQQAAVSVQNFTWPSAATSYLKVFEQVS